ncbi:MAG TPA: pilus assembly protein N-terminal domain-containing protein [Pseudorhodoplanes sp.]|jgi:Flp pilus assembly secretin CpaC|nr:pilus assembly protein N-terminal domain-containing protein [Pseudorhodoplanes sp.]
MIGVLTRLGAAAPAAAICAALFLLPAKADAPGDEDRVTVQLDQATIMKVPDRVATLVVGNPLIADVTLQPGNIAVLTGKGYGITNVMVLDRSGAVLTEKIIQVKGPVGNVVTVYRGVARETYNCAPKCEPRNTLGDAQPYFDGTLGQIATRSGLAQGASPDSK